MIHLPSLLTRNSFVFAAIYFVICRNADILPLGVDLLLVPPNGESDAFLPALSMRPQSLWAAGVRSPDTRGLLGKLGAGVLSTLPVTPSRAEVLLDCDIRSTMRWWRASRFLCS